MNALASSPELVAYLRKRCADHAVDRDRSLLRIEECGVSRAEAHKLTWALRRAEAENTALREEVSAVTAQLATERRRVVAVTRDNEELALALRAEETKLQHLLSASDPQIEELSYEAGAVPSKVVQHISGPSGGQRTVRLVYLASEQNDALQARCASLEARLDQESEVHVTIERALVDDRERREGEAKEAVERAAESLVAMQQRAERAEERLQNALAAGLTDRFAAQEAERGLREKVASLSACNGELSRQLQTETARLKAHAARQVNSAEARATGAVAVHRSEEMRAKAGMKAAVQKAEKVEEASTARVSALQEKVARLARQQEQAKRVASIQREAVKSEAADLRQKLRVMEGVLASITAAEAQELRREVQEAKPRVEALRMKADALR